MVRGNSHSGRKTVDGGNINNPFVGLAGWVVTLKHVFIFPVTHPGYSSQVSKTRWLITHPKHHPVRVQPASKQGNQRMVGTHHPPQPAKPSVGSKVFPSTWTSWRLIPTLHVGVGGPPFVNRTPSSDDHRGETDMNWFFLWFLSQPFGCLKWLVLVGYWLVLVGYV